MTQGDNANVVDFTDGGLALFCALAPTPKIVGTIEAFMSNISAGAGCIRMISAAVGGLGSGIRNTAAWAGSILETVAASVLAVFGTVVGGCKLRTLVDIVVFTRSGGALD